MCKIKLSEEVRKNRVIITNNDASILSWKNEKNEILFTDTNEGLFPGKYLFKLEDTMGFPLDFAVLHLFEHNLKIEWVSYIEASRQSRYDFQTFNKLEVLKRDMMEIDKEKYKKYFDEVIYRFKLYVMKFPQNI